jgi:L-ascorbate metabolism protein UlaG (beta-lactamase superfamily)
VAGAQRAGKMTYGLLLAIAVTLSACSSVPGNTFSDLPKPPATPYVELHYLGNGGWVIQRGADKIATAPFVSNPNGLMLWFPGGPNEELIKRLVPPMHDVPMILVGHGHYDHAMDLPSVHKEKAPNADIYGSTTVVNTLAPVRALAGKLKEIKESEAASGDQPGRWLPSETSTVRFMPLRSTHAPHIGRWKILPSSNVDEARTKLPCCPAQWHEGQVFAFIIDFLDKSGAVEFRVYYQDSASSPGTGIAPVFPADQKAAVDVAILTVASFNNVDRNPEHVLTNLEPRHVIGGHWEDFFFQSHDNRPVRPVPGTNLEEFHRRARALSPNRPIYLPNPGDKVYIPIQPRP